MMTEEITKEREIDPKKIKEKFNEFLKQKDTVKFIDFFKKYWFILLIIIPLLVNYDLRTTPRDLPIMETYARESIYSNMKDQFREQLRSQYPNLPQENLENGINEEFSKYVADNKQQIDIEIDGASNYLKAFMQDEYGHTYLLAIDPYFWARLANNVADHGYPGDSIRLDLYGETVYYDDYMLAPRGRSMPSDMFHAYFEGYLYRAVKMFNRDVQPEHVYFYTPIILFSFAIIFGFFIARKIGGNIAGFFTAIIIAIHPAMLTRTVAGFADTDSYNLFFPLLIFWMFLLSFDAKSTGKKILYAVLVAFFMGLFSIAWGGWWYVLIYIILTCCLCAGFSILLYLKKNKSFKNIHKDKNIIKAGLEAVLITSLCLLVVVLIRGWSTITGLYSGVINFVKLHHAHNVWPNEIGRAHV